MIWFNLKLGLTFQKSYVSLSEWKPFENDEEHFLFHVIFFSFLR